MNSTVDNEDYSDEAPLPPIIYSILNWYRFMVKGIVVSVVSIALLSCSFFRGTDEEILLQCQSYISHELRIDGYYHEGEIAPDEAVEVYYFYRNGVLFSPGTYSGKNFYDKVLNDNHPDTLSVIKKAKMVWGVYQVDKGKLIFEKWEPASGPYFIVYRRTGEILNDTTFSIDHLQDSQGPLTKFQRKIFHFKQFKKKPDSTNEFIRCP